MPSRRYYSNTSTQQQTASSINSSATSVSISGSFSGWSAQFPFFATLDINTASEEVVSVTNIVGTTATIVRGQDGTTAMSHAAGATFDQTVVRQDLDEANAHTSSNSGVHGVSGSVVGTTDAQTLTNKTLTTPVVNGFTGTGNGTVTGNLSVSGTATIGTNHVTGNETVGGTLGVTGALSANGITNTSDTGWVALTGFAANWGVNSFGYTPAYKIFNGTTVRLRGQLKSSATIPAGGSNMITTVQAAIIPAQTVEATGAVINNSNATAVRLDISSAGIAIYTPASFGASTWVSLDSVLYDLV